jgi:hypothetical protein
MVQLFVDDPTTTQFSNGGGWDLCGCIYAAIKVGDTRRIGLLAFATSILSTILLYGEVAS